MILGKTVAPTEQQTIPSVAKDPTMQMLGEWSNAILDDLEPTKQWSHHNIPFLTDLSNFANTARTKAEQIQTPVGMPEGEAKLHLSRIPPNEAGPEVAEMLGRIAQKTGYFRQLTELGTDTSLIGSLKEGQYIAPVIFLTPDNIFNGLLGRITGNEYGGHALGKICFVEGENINPKDLWMLLATEGTLPQTAAIIQHELAHTTQGTVLRMQEARFAAATDLIAPLLAFLVHRQLGSGVSIFYTLTYISYRFLKHNRQNAQGNYNITDLISEIHAFEAMSEVPVSGATSPSEPPEIVDLLIEKYGLRQEDMEIAYTTLAQIRTLRALGLSHNEIGQIVSKLKYDSEARSFHLEDILKQELHKRGITESIGIDPNQIYAAANAKFELEIAFNRHEAIRIATQSLRRF
ncbi:hypothetical protein KC622_01960 [Candidatus Dojkabacteria bacterium]|uniref:Uncharacterized protein n=1 Tax=Candidatus Dojkabacteria bacterium TaxID=2099670 RepID=A0A955KWL0_9BACT|nr:hypothetical protein [Candidatus Dojkabacteria bacterium]